MIQKYKKFRRNDMRVTPGYLMAMNAIEREEEKRKKEAELKRNNNIYGSEYCPVCGSEMQLREGKYGTFWGCKRYPKCSGTKHI